MSNIGVLVLLPTLIQFSFPWFQSNSTRWSKFHPLYDVIGGGVKKFSSLKHNLLQQFPYFPSQLVGLIMPHHYLLYKVSGSH
jgi:hypothetical protein